MKKSIVATYIAVLMCLLCTAAAFAAGSEIPEMPGGQLLISEAGTYRFVGSMRGTILVDPGEGDVVLIMDNFSIDGGNSAGIAALSGDSLTISLADHSVNSITDGRNNSELDAAVYSRVPTFFDGYGALNIQGSNREAIHVENADLTFNNGLIKMTAPTNAIAVDGNEPGMLVFDNGSFYMNSEGTGISPQTNVQYRGGKVWASDINGRMVTPSWGMNNDLNDAEVLSVYQANQGNTMPWMNQNNGFFTQEQQPDNQQASFLQPQNQWQGPEFSGTEMNNADMPARPGQNFSSMQKPSMPNQPGQMPENMQQPGMNSNYESASSPSEIVSGTMTNSAMELTADYDSATTITVTDDNSQVKISESGTYVVTGSASDGNITVKKDTTGVVLVLQDLDLTSTTGATVSINKNAEVQVIISGNVTLTDAENPADENSTDADVADAFDGAALKAKAGSQVYVTGNGTLTINGNAKNGIKGGDESSIIIDGITMNITAANDGINSNYDVTLLSGNYTINAGDDAIHADHILTIGDEKGHGPTINVTNSNEGLEGTVVNIFGGDITVHSTDDAINAANGDGTYEGELAYAINMTGGKVTINSQGDGLDSNGDINLMGGIANISSGSFGGEAGIDYDGQLYISDEFRLNNNSGVAGPDGMPGGMNGQEWGPMNSDFSQNSTPDFGNLGNQDWEPMNGGQPGSFQQGKFSGNRSDNFSGRPF